MTEQETKNLLALTYELADNAKWLIEENERLQSENAVLWKQVLSVESLVWDRHRGGTC
jgi:regulator of replication initiation timing